ncbi:MAG: 30S ribosomal protein S4 [Actinomycetia bacterium]|jgi:small subunit ribosomal protein S4|nr:30S ribosomal protein S4 [Actinomycetes bacterium]
MARYTGPVCRLCRREGTKLYLKGEKCYTDKCPVVRRPFPPGQHGQARRKLSEYGVQLREKQKLRRTYGVLEGQFRRYLDKASRKTGVTGTTLLQLLERRLDNVVYRMGFASSRAEARQLVRHGHFTVNGRKVDIPSFSTRPGDVIAVRESSRDKGRFKEVRESAPRGVPAWLEVDRPALKGTVVRLPSREEIDVPVQEHLVIELYSR